jgi:hypothetical protein
VVVHASGTCSRGPWAGRGSRLAGPRPGTGVLAALRGGTLSLGKARIIAAATGLPDPGEAAAAEAGVLDRAARLTPGGLRAAIARAVMQAAPGKARKRRETAARFARVERWAEDSGNAALAGRELSPDQVLAADERITARARELKAAGVEGGLDELRARALLDLLLGPDSRPRNDEDSTPSSAAAGFAGRVTLTVPLATLAGLADRPGDLAGLGPVARIPKQIRSIVTRPRHAPTGAAGPASTYCGKDDAPGRLRWRRRKPPDQHAAIPPIRKEQAQGGQWNPPGHPARQPGRRHIPNLPSTTPAAASASGV